MTTKRDYYEVLGLDRTATPDAIKAAYRKLARQNHPDLNPDDPGAEARFKEVAEAYEVLSDASKRQAYDRFGHDGPSAMGGGNAGQGFGGFDDLFSAVFGGAFGGQQRAANAPQRGADLETSITLTLEDAFRGGEKTVRIPRVETCGTCSGSGATPGSSVETCVGCGGVGQIRQTQSLGFMTVQNVVPCAKCGGRGKAIKDPCADCAGRGRVQRHREIQVPVPPGVDDGMQLPLPGQGQAGSNGGPAGDLYVTFQVSDHERFERDGLDLFVELPLTFAQAALGDDVPVPTLEGADVSIKVPEATQAGNRFLLKGHGMPDVRNPLRRGNLHAIAKILVPTKLTGEEKAALRYFAELRGEEPGTGRLPDEPRGLFGRFRRGKGEH